MSKLWTFWNKERKKSSPGLKGQENRWGARGENWTRILGDSQEPEILGMCSKARLGLRQFKEACPETQRTSTDMSLSATQWCKEGLKRFGDQQLMSKGLVHRGTQEDELWRMVTRDLLAWKEGINSLGKMTKGKVAKMWVWKGGILKPWKKKDQRSAL